MLFTIILLVVKSFLIDLAICCVMKMNDRLTWVETSTSHEIHLLDYIIDLFPRVLVTIWLSNVVWFSATMFSQVCNIVANFILSKTFDVLNPTTQISVASRANQIVAVGTFLWGLVYFWYMTIKEDLTRN